MIIKVCGMRESQNISDVVAAGANWTGLIFYPKSPRYVTEVPEISADVKRVGVFVDADIQEIISTAIDYRLDILQLHGNESPAIIRELRSSASRQVRQDIKIMKAISIGNADDMQTFRRYEDCVDLFLFDTRCETSGGSGRQFDWTIINAYDGNRPFLLSGGIGPDDASRVMLVHHPMMLGIDINSKFETAPACKDAEAVRRFIGKLADLEKKANEMNIQNQTQVIL